MRIATALCIIFLLNACAMPGGSIGAGTAELSVRDVAGTTYDYSHVSPDVVLANNLKNVAFAVYDSRPFVTVEQQPPSTVGAVQPERGGEVIIKTASGNPFAHDVTLAIGRLFEKNGIVAKPVLTPHTLSLHAAQSLLFLQRADRHVFLVLHQWGTDTFLETRLVYDLELIVTDITGQMLANGRISGSESLGRSTQDPLSIPKNRAAPTLRSKLQLLFSTPEVLAVL